jgi:uncharacterized membrane protein SirB2
MDYQTVKTLHMGAVALSATGFAVRGLAALRGAAWVQGRAAKTLPHVLDTLLLLSALSLVWMLGLNPLTTPWLLAKLLGLLLYIALGMLVLRPRFALSLRAAAWLAALLVLGWIVSVALSKNPMGFL